MAANHTSRRPVLLLLFLLTLTGGGWANPLAATGGNVTKTPPGSTRGRILYVTGLRFTDIDYEDPDQESGGTPPAPTPDFNPQPCDYNRCHDNQTPCAQLREASGCLCPGLSGPQELPEAPFLQEVALQASGVRVHWCAPTSTVERYKVMVEGRGPVEFGESTRTVVLEGLEVGGSYRVCVQAVNPAGSSPLTESSCSKFQVKPDTQVGLLVGLIAGAVLVLLSIAVGGYLLWRRRSRRKEVRGAAAGEGLGNPTYTTDGPM
ncbi:LRRN4 C-terminal-like protein [Amia ocellicauda]|uniref:LRRN4 C-terminal-like protein n=1 Tax=Amia ocellicauda TaxID=2972642 RepID=UPI003464117C